MLAALSRTSSSITVTRYYGQIMRPGGGVTHKWSGWRIEFQVRGDNGRRRGDIGDAGVRSRDPHGGGTEPTHGIRVRGVSREHAAQPGKYEAFFISPADPSSFTPTIDLVRDAYPAAVVKGNLEGLATAISIDKTRRVLDWEPKVTWREACTFGS